MPVCKICKSKQTKFFYKIKNYSYYFCPRCLTLSLHPTPSEKQISHYYRQNFDYSAGRDNENQIRFRARTILKRLKNLNPQGRTLLDIGSGYGYFLDEAKKFGFSASGIEPSKNLILQSINLPAGRQGRLNDQTHNLTFDQYYAKYRTKRFDFITIIHTIEHVTDPQTMISKAIKLLNVEGILFIETPNLDSHLFYAEKLRYTFLTPPDHIWLFSLKSFKNMFKRLRGVKLEKISTYSYPEHFMGIIKSKLLITNYKLQINVKLKNPNEKTNSQNKKRKFIKYLLFDRLLAPLFTPLLNIGIKGSILELYISKI